MMSQDHMGANTIFNLLNRAEILMITEGLDVFSQKTPESLIGEKLKDSKIREKTGCSIVALKEMAKRLSRHHRIMSLQRTVKLF